MNARTYLNQIRLIETRIQHKKVEKKRWMELATGLSVGMGERVSSSGNKQRMATAIENGIDKDCRIDFQIKELIAQREEIINTIEQLPEREADVLYQKYVSGKKLKEIEFERSEAESTISQSHRTALKLLQKILDERENAEKCV